MPFMRQAEICGVSSRRRRHDPAVGCRRSRAPPARRPAPDRRHRRPVSGVQPDGHTLASASTDGTVRPWDVADPAHPSQLGQPLTGSTLAVDSVAFSPDGRTLASASDDGTTRLWNSNVRYAIQRICATAGGLTPRQWNQYIPQLRYQPSCVH